MVSRKPTGRALLYSKVGGSVDDPYRNLALEEALFQRNEGFIVRLWEDRESVVIGRAQLAEFETNMEYCKSEGIPIVRRFTAGGAVYHGPGNVNWSLFVSSSVSAGALRYETSPHGIFRSASRPLLSSLEECGVEAEFDPPNRVLSGAGKISGMAAYVSRKGFLCHGTLLVSANLERVKALTTPSSAALERKYTRSRDVRTANAAVDVDLFIRTFLSTLAEETGMAIKTGAPSRAELALARRLLASRYSKDAWNFGDPFASEATGL